MFLTPFDLEQEMVKAELTDAPYWRVCYIEDIDPSEEGLDNFFLSQNISKYLAKINHFKRFENSSTMNILSGTKIKSNIHYSKIWFVYKNTQFCTTLGWVRTSNNKLLIKTSKVMTIAWQDFC